MGGAPKLGLAWLQLEALRKALATIVLLALPNLLFLLLARLWLRCCRRFSKKLLAALNLLVFFGNFGHLYSTFFCGFFNLYAGAYFAPTHILTMRMFSLHVSQCKQTRLPLCCEIEFVVVLCTLHVVNAPQMLLLILLLYSLLLLLLLFILLPTMLAVIQYFPPAANKYFLCENRIVVVVVCGCVSVGACALCIVSCTFAYLFWLQLWVSFISSFHHYTYTHTPTYAHATTLCAFATVGGTKCSCAHQNQIKRIFIRLFYFQCQR